VPDGAILLIEDILQKYELLCYLIKDTSVRKITMIRDRDLGLSCLKRKLD
jgi:hypothetical protein